MRHTPTPSEGCRDAAKEIFFFSSPRAFQSSRRRNDPLLFPVPPGEIPCAAAWRPRGRLPSLPRSIPVASCKAVRPDAHDALAKSCAVFSPQIAPLKRVLMRAQPAPEMEQIPITSVCEHLGLWIPWRNCPLFIFQCDFESRFPLFLFIISLFCCR